MSMKGEVKGEKQSAVLSIPRNLKSMKILRFEKILYTTTAGLHSF